MEDKIATTQKVTFKKYKTPLDTDGTGENLIEYGVILETKIKDVDGNEVIVDRKETPMKDQTKESLLTQLESGRVGILAKHAEELSAVEAQIAQIKKK